jgi:AraC-like DNA-binding protein
MDTLDPRMIIINLYPCAPGFCTNARIFRNPYMLYIHSGKGDIQIGDVRYVSRPGDLFFCPEGVANTIFADRDDPFVLSGIDFLFRDNEQGPTVTYTQAVDAPSTDSTGVEWKPPDPVQIMGASAFGATSNDPEPVHTGTPAATFPLQGIRSLPEQFEPVLHLSADSGHLFLIHEMIRAYQDSTLLSMAYCNAVLRAFLLYVLYLQASGRGVPNPASEILRFLSDHSSVATSIEDIGRQFNYHPCTINRLVRQATGLSAKEYQIDVRIKRARNLLLYSSRSITEIAMECGYSDVFFFSRQFKRKTGTLPRDYRRNSDATKV